MKSRLEINTPATDEVTGATAFAIIHDYMYDNALRTKKEADLIFLDEMRVLRVLKWKRTVLYYAVQMFGMGLYEQNRTLPGV
ncbi:DUF1353 domain-containing protein [Salmonella enterica]|nr:DUF1353 domain-containing protein [Salmonella enterica]